MKIWSTKIYHLERLKNRHFSKSSQILELFSETGLFCCLETENSFVQNSALFCTLLCLQDLHYGRVIYRKQKTFENFGSHRNFNRLKFIVKLNRK